MPADVTAYLLLFLAVVAVAVVLTLPLLLLFWVIGRLRRKPAGHGTKRPARSAPEPEQAPASHAKSGERVLRRCDDCGVGWKGVPGRDKSSTGLKVRRWVRRRARARKKHSPSWTKRQGWSRCPSCLSTNVRTSSRHASDV